MKRFPLFPFLLFVPALTCVLLTGCGSSTASAAGSTATTTSLTASSSSTTTGKSITLNATISATAATGTVTFYNGSSSLGTGTLSSGKATLSTSFSAEGTYSVKAVYGGSSTYGSSTSSIVSIAVTSSTTSTTTALTSSSTSTTTGTSIALTATVSPSAATGTVTFYQGATSLGSATLDSGTATLTTSFTSAGTYTLTATYGGDSTYATSTSSSITETVTSASSTGTSSTASLAPTPATAYPGSLVLLTATVAPTAATGTVTFYQGSNSLGTATLTSGTANLTTHFSTAGAYKLSAVYGGDSTYSSSTSSTVSETVAAGNYSLSLSGYTCSSETMTVTTDSSHTVVYNLCENVVYAANPVDDTYESMNIYIPTTVDGTAVSSKPILLDNNVAGYLSSSTYGNPQLASTNAQYALGKGYVVVEVGCRGRDNVSSGTYYGKAPAAIVDLKAAVRFLHYNYAAGTFTGDVTHIISSGGSAGGALSTLLGASGNSTLYDSYLAAIGAADADDNIFAVGAWSPITNLDHADMSYESEYGSLDYNGSAVNSTISGDLQTSFQTYQDDLALTGKRDSYGSLTSSNLDEYILTKYLEPSAATYLESLSATALSAYLAANTFITWDSTNKVATFTFANYLSHIGSRGKSVPAFDSFFDLTTTLSDVNTTATAEATEFGSGTTNVRHFTNFSSGYVDNATISADEQTIVNMMNPMYFITSAISSGDASGIAKYWYVRDGSIATDTSAVVIVDLTTSLEDLLGTTYVNAAEDWDKGHNVNADPGGFSTWVRDVVASN